VNDTRHESKIVELTRRMNALAAGMSENRSRVTGAHEAGLGRVKEAESLYFRTRLDDRVTPNVASLGAPEALQTVSTATRNALVEGLRHALQLEFATIPAYLVAQWSIIDQDHPAARSIRAVAHEEMLHLSLISNLLVALGETPELQAAAPRYPLDMNDLGIDLVLSLRGFGPQSLQDFMRIERPEVPVQIVDEPLQAFDSGTNTIGQFYDGLLRLYQSQRPPLNSARQVAGPFTWFVMTEPKHVAEAIGVIVGQGEGARGVPFNRHHRHLSHYYRFRSLHLGRDLVWDERIRSLRKGDAIRPPSTFNVPPPPAEGYGAAAPAEILHLDARFNELYAAMVGALDDCWNGEGEPAFLRSIEFMFELRAVAQTMMRTPRADGRGHCPTFALPGRVQRRLE